MRKLLGRAAACAVLACLGWPQAVADEARTTTPSREGRAAKRAHKQLKKAIRKETTAGLRVEGKRLEANLARVETLAWHDDAATALEAAREEDKLVFLMNVLGDRCGHV